MVLTNYKKSSWDYLKGCESPFSKEPNLDTYYYHFPVHFNKHSYTGLCKTQIFAPINNSRHLFLHSAFP